MASDISFEDLKNENVDLVRKTKNSYHWFYFFWPFENLFITLYVYVQEHIPVEEVFKQLKCTREGLTSAEGEKRLQVFGPNKLEEKTDSKLLKFLGFMWNPLSWVMEVAAIMAIVLANGGVIKKNSSLYVLVFIFDEKLLVGLELSQIYNLN